MIRFLGGDCRDVLKTLPDRSVQCVVTSPPYFGLRSYLDAGHADKRLEIGSEPTPALYVAEMVAVFREVRRVLRDDGTCWLNLGDSYASSPPGNKTVGVSASSGLNGINGASGKYRETLAAGHATKLDTSKIAGFKAKDLLMIPARVAIALQADGWYLRSDIIWHKSNPMPESATDRPTSAHEHVCLLTKRERYFYDADAIAEVAMNTGGGTVATPDKAARAGITTNGTGATALRAKGAEYRNARNVWTIATTGFPGAHFATMPPELAERCIKAGTSERGACPACGAPWARMVQKTRTRDGEPLAGSFNNGDGHKIGATGVGHWRDVTVSETSGWRPTCECPPADPVPCVALDPFSGAGTTALVSDRLGRDAIGIDLNPTYGEMARERLVKDAGMFAVFE